MITLASGLSYLDLNFYGVKGVIASVILHGPGGAAIIDPGPSSTLPALRAGLDGVVAQQANYRKSGFALAYANIRYGGTIAASPAPPTRPTSSPAAARSTSCATAAS